MWSAKMVKGTIAKSINLKNFTEKLSMANSKPLRESVDVFETTNRFVNGNRRNLKGISQVRKPWDWNSYLKKIAHRFMEKNSRYIFLIPMVSHLGIEPNHGGRKSRCEFRLVLVDSRPQRYKKNRWRCWSLRLDPCFTPKKWGWNSKDERLKAFC